MAKEKKSTVKTNHLGIYLIKDDITNPDDATNIATDTDIRKKEITGVGTFYYKHSKAYTPNWVDKFFLDGLVEQKNILQNSSARGLLIVRLKSKGRGKDKFFGIPFGTGRFIMKEGVWEERFGLKTTLNIVSVNGIKGLGKKTLSQNPKISIEQVSKAGVPSDFFIDVEKDIIQSITGNSKKVDFGKVITGKDALYVSYKIDITNIVQHCKLCYDYYRKDDYKKDFEWIDKLREISAKSLIEKLNNKLIALLQKKSPDVWLATPDIINWGSIGGFKYSIKKAETLYTDLDISDYYKTSSFSTAIVFDDISDILVTAWDNDEENVVYRWKFFNCLNVEISHYGKHYLLDGGKWYEISQGFVNEVNAVVDKIPWINLTKIAFDTSKKAGYKESDYNTELARELKGYVLDAKNISHGGGHSLIEFCDVLTTGKKLIYVKRYHGSAGMSHLFAQGYVSAALLLNDQFFREKIVKKLPSAAKGLIPIKAIKTSDYHLIYAIISKDKRKTNLPFFSKINLKNIYTTLTNFRYKVSLAHIENHSK